MSVSKPTCPETLEAATQRHGRALLSAMARERPSRLSAEGIEERLMTMLMLDPDLRSQILRFIDVYPSLRASPRVREHLAAYLVAAPRPEGRIPAIAHLVRIFANLTDHGWTPQWLADAVSRWGVAHMARRFIVETDAVESLHCLEKEGCLFTLDVLGEKVHSAHEADAFAQRYLDLVSNLGERLGGTERAPRRGPRVNLSIKLSALAAHFDPTAPARTAAEVRERLLPILRAAQRSGAFINVDMEHFEVRDLTWHLFRDFLGEEEFSDWENVGIAVQAYLRDAPKHLREVLDWLRISQRARITIRLVKGAYWDSEQIWARQRNWPIPVLLSKAQTDHQCEQMVETLLENRDLVRVALGSHNARTISRGLALAERLGTPPGDFEVQVLHGMGETLSRALVKCGIPTRVYVPWGQLIPGMAYMVRRLLENTSNESFLRQIDMAKGQVETLLRDPASELPRREAA